jgi:glyoxylase-like metal-dependent hydrolase (beta-lactamase superfamily II)
MEVARQSGVPEEPLRRWAQEHRGPIGMAGHLRSDRDLLPGVSVTSDHGDWRVIETPGHAPSHVCLHQPDLRVLISGDHLLGRISLYFDVGWTPDPVGEFLGSLDAIEGLGARLALSGHGRPFTDLPGHVNGNRALVAEQLDDVRRALAPGPATAYDVARAVYGERFGPDSASWLLSETIAWLTHLHAVGEAAPERGDDDVERWRGS